MEGKSSRRAIYFVSVSPSDKGFQTISKRAPATEASIEEDGSIEFGRWADCDWHECFLSEAFGWIINSELNINAKPSLEIHLRQFCVGDS